MCRLSVPFHTLWWVSFLRLLLWLFSFKGSEESCIFPTFLLIFPSLTRLTFCLLLSSGSLFDPEAVRLVQAEMKEDFAVSANVQLAKVISLPSFATGRDSRKASSGNPAQDQAQSSSSSAALSTSRDASSRV